MFGGGFGSALAYAMPAWGEAIVFREEPIPDKLPQQWTPVDSNKPQDWDEGSVEERPATWQPISYE